VAVGLLTALLYTADAVLFNGVRWAVALQLGLFALVGLAAGILGDRLRRAGQALGKVESELRQLRHTTSDILGTISAGVLTIDGDGRLVYLNPSGERLLGLDSREWGGRPVVDVVRDVAPELGAFLDRSRNEGIPFARRTSNLPRPDGNLTLGVSTAVLSHAETARSSVTAIFQDITDQERLAALNRRTERLEAVAELSASLAHEIKNPLASIRSAVEQLSSPTLDSSDQALLQTLVLRESDRLSRLLSDFLDFSGLRLGDTEPVELRRLLSECIDVARQHPDTAEGPAIELSLGSAPIYVKGDPDLLHRAVFNLVLNAVQFSDADGRVVVSLAPDPLGSARGAAIPNPVRISVRDTGPGIDPDEMLRIFDAFFTTRRGGTGLGLAVVHRAVEAHDGAVFVDQPPEGGTEFVLFLPATASDEAS